MISKTEYQSRKKASEPNCPPPPRPKNSCYKSLKNINSKYPFGYKSLLEDRGSLQSESFRVKDDAPLKEYSKDDCMLDDVYDICDSEYVLPSFKSSLRDIKLSDSKSGTMPPLSTQLRTPDKATDNVFDSKPKMELKDKPIVPLVPPVASQNDDSQLLRTCANCALSHPPIKLPPKMSNQGTQTPSRENVIDIKDSLIESAPKAKRTSLDEVTLRGPETSKEITPRNYIERSLSVDNGVPKLLDNIFSRKWVESLGDGIKKKAVVMSELMKSFNDEKFQHFGRKLQKTLFAFNLSTKGKGCDSG